MKLNTIVVVLKILRTMKPFIEMIKNTHKIRAKRDEKLRKAIDEADSDYVKDCLQEPEFKPGSPRDAMRKNNGD